MVFQFSLPANHSRPPMEIMKGDIFVKRQTTNCTVRVVPISAPRMMAKELEKPMRPALTRLIVSAVEVPELWKIMVEKMPVRRPKKGLPTAYLIYSFIRTSINFRTALERLITPTRNRTILQITMNISLIAKSVPWKQYVSTWMINQFF